MGDGLTVDLGSALPYVIDSVLSLFGKDTASIDWKQKVQYFVKLSAEQASSVQCIGMAKPVPITKIYQTTRLTFEQPDPETLIVTGRNSSPRSKQFFSD